MIEQQTLGSSVLDNKRALLTSHVHQRVKDDHQSVLLEQIYLYEEESSIPIANTRRPMLLHFPSTYRGGITNYQSKPIKYRT